MEPQRGKCTRPAPVPRPQLRHYRVLAASSTAFHGKQTPQMWRGDVRKSFMNNVKCTNTHTFINVKVHISEINVKENDKDFLVQQNK